jgi:Tfp pilus assembly protein PilF
MRVTHFTLFIVLGNFHEAFADDSSLEERLRSAKLELWKRGEHNYGQYTTEGATLDEKVKSMEMAANWSPMRLGPVRKVRSDYFLEQGQDQGCIEFECQYGSNMDLLNNLRGGGAGADTGLEKKLELLGAKFGPEFTRAIEKNKEEHSQDCAVSCESFYCAKSSNNDESWDASVNLKNGTSFESFSFGPTPPEDFSEGFGFPLDLIKVTKGEPLFSADEAALVIKMAQEEGVDNNEYTSGKYKLGGDWLTNLPNTRKWFNDKLETTLFPLLSNLFPEIVSSPSVLRAHSVSLLKYNVTHPRTDVHVDNGILAMTLAMTPQDEYKGGGTFYEHMDSILPMDVGHGTFRPGSVRHGGQKVLQGTRYILGAFLLIEDRVEHVRRLKNRGSDLRRIPDLEGAATHFQWALALNPKCTTCLKDWAEILLTQKKYDEAEMKLRKVIELLEDKDSDALFSLGVVLSESGKDDESIEAYTKSVKLNAEDAELCYNLGIKLGAKGDTKAEMAMYARATNADPKFGGKYRLRSSIAIRFLFLLGLTML